MDQSARPASLPIGAPGSIPRLFANPTLRVLRSNDKFGMNLLSETYKTALDRNFVIAPLPVSLTFAALLEGSASADNRKELISTFQWQGNDDISIAGRMLHARFAEPNPKPPGYPEGSGFPELSSIAARAR
jgi:hypothetical protein